MAVAVADDESSKCAFAALLDVQAASLLVQEGLSELIHKCPPDLSNGIWDELVKIQRGAAEILKSAVRFQQSSLADLRRIEAGKTAEAPFATAEAVKAKGDSLLAANEPASAIEAYREALAFHRPYPEAEHNLSIACLNAGRYSDAHPVLASLFDRRFGLPVEQVETFQPRQASVSPGELPTASPFRLQDFREQISHLVERGRLNRSFVELVERVQDVEEEIASDPGRKPYCPLSQDQARRLGGYFGKAVHYHRTGRIAARAINPDLDWRKLEEQYLDTECIHFDDLMSEECLTALRAHFMESTIFNRYSEAGFVASYVTEGFHCDLIFQFIEEMSEKLPRVLGGKHLNNMWCYRYASSGPGVRPHNGDGSVTINFYLTPDSANLSPNGGGMVMYDKVHPKEWDWLKYNMHKDDPEIQREIGDYLRGSMETKVPYKCNRAVLFRSDLFHKTDPFIFADSFESRRMNITMLFGKRAAESAPIL